MRDNFRDWFRVLNQELAVHAPPLRTVVAKFTGGRASEGGALLS